MLGDDPSSLSLSSSFNEFNSSSLQDTQVFENVSFADGLLESGETIKELTNAWMNERNSPELLTYKGYLVNELVEQLDYQVS